MAPTAIDHSHQTIHIDDKPKPILKNKFNDDNDIEISTSKSASPTRIDVQKARSSSHIHFDEKVIKEHDKLRGTRQKIDEPKTPYEKSLKQTNSLDANEESGSHFKGVSLDMSELKNKMEKMGGKGDESDEVVGNYGRDVDVVHAENVAKQQDFEEHRKKHYNEFQKMKEFLKKHENDDESEDVDEKVESNKQVKVDDENLEDEEDAGAESEFEEKRWLHNHNEFKQAKEFLEHHKDQIVHHTNPSATKQSSSE